MKYNNTVTLKDGRACILRNGTASDGQALLEVFNRTHEQTDYLLTYPEEHSYTAEDEAEMLRRKTDSADEIELLAFVDGRLCRQKRKTPTPGRIRYRSRSGILGPGRRSGFDGGVHRVCQNGGLYPAGTGGRGGERCCPFALQKCGIRRVRPKPQRLSLQDERLAGSGVDASGTGRPVF